MPKKNLHENEVDEKIDEAYLQALAKRLEGFSGRQIAKTVLAFQSAVFGSGTNKITKGYLNFEQ